MSEALTARRGRLRALALAAMLVAAGLLALTAIQPGRADAKRAHLAARTRAHVSIAALSNSVLVVGDVTPGHDDGMEINPGDGLALKLATVLSDNGYQTTTSATLPGDLSQYGSVWYVSATPLTFEQQLELEYFVRMGRGLYLQDGEYLSNASDGYEASVINVLTSGDVSVTRLGNSPEHPLGDGALNPNALDGLGSDCDQTCSGMAATFSDSFTGVPSANVLATVVQNAVVTASTIKHSREPSVRTGRAPSVKTASAAWLDPPITLVTAAAYDHDSILGGRGALIAAGGDGWVNLNSLYPYLDAPVLNFERFLSSQAAETATNGATYVALGDSYSSGEGNPPFAANGGPNGCDRSVNNAYPDIIAKDLHLAKNGQAFDFEACSGATTGDIWPNSPDHRGQPKFGNYYEMSGLTTGEAGIGLNTKLVTITVGGDDIGFSDIVSKCASLRPFTGLTQKVCPKDESKKSIWVRDAKQNIKALRAQLVDLYEGIELRAPQAVGHIYVLGYPQLFRPTLKENSGASCHVATAQLPQTLVWMYKVQQQLNAVIESAAKQAKIKYVDPNKRGARYSFLDHTFCSSHGTWFNDVPNSELQGNQGWAYHPDGDGQAALAAALVAAGATKTKVR